MNNLWNEAAKNGNVKQLQELYATNNDEVTQLTLEIACKYNHKDCAEFLISKCNLKITKRVLQICIKYENKDLFSYLKRKLEIKNAEIKLQNQLKSGKDAIDITIEEENQDTYELMFGKK